MFLLVIIINRVFAPASNPLKCWVTFQIDFKFKSAMYNNISDLFMSEVVNNMVKAFENRCHDLYKKDKQKY
jgi:ribosome-associated toxin RatA of RatAB toxin-antitoxin module